MARKSSEETRQFKVGGDVEYDGKAAKVTRWSGGSLDLQLPPPKPMAKPEYVHEVSPREVKEIDADQVKKLEEAHAKSIAPPTRGEKAPVERAAPKAEPAPTPPAKRSRPVKRAEKPAAKKPAKKK